MLRKIRIQVGSRFGGLSNDKVRYELKTPYRDGTTHVIFEPLDCIARFVALVPKPRVNLLARRLRLHADR
jgi:hypothetical protein